MSEMIKKKFYENFSESIGNTPIIKLKRASNITKCNKKKLYFPVPLGSEA